MAVNEDLQDEMIGREVRNLRAMAGVQNDVDAILRKLQRDVKAVIDRVNPDAVKTRAAKLRRQERINAEVAVLITSAYREINVVVRAALRRFGKNETRSMVSAIRKVLPGEIKDVIAARPREISAEVANKIATQTIIEGSVMREHWSRLSRRTQNLVADRIRQGINSGLSNQRITATVIGGTVDGVKVPGVMVTTRRNAAVLVRTGTNAILNAAREATIQNNLDIVAAIQQVSTLDGRTSDICIAYSGAAWKAETLEPIPPNKLPYNSGPPRHFNCRSTVIPVLKGGPKFGGVDLSPTTRASMDGQVPADITFDAWLRTKSKAFQDEMLGVGKAKLWRAKKISLTQLVDMTGRPLTLAQLENLVDS